MSVIVDRLEYGSAWREAPLPGGCKACGTADCGHSDLEFAGLVPPLGHPPRCVAALRESSFPHAAENARG